MKVENISFAEAMDVVAISIVRRVPAIGLQPAFLIHWVILWWSSPKHNPKVTHRIPVSHHDGKCQCVSAY